VRVGPCVCLGLAPVLLLTSASALGEDRLSDPFATSRGLPATAAEPWQSTAELPSLPKLPPPAEDWSGHDWSLAALTAYALAHNPQTAAAWNGLRAQAAALGVAESAWLPTLTLSTSASRRQAVSTAGFSVPVRNGVAPNLTLSYTLWDFGLRRAKVDAAKAQEWVAGFTLNQNIQAVAFAVAQAYYQVLGDRALLLADRQTVAEQETNLEAAELLHRAGQATIGALYQARAALAQARSALAAQEESLRASQGSLAAAVGLPPATEIRVADLHLDAPPPALAAAADALMQAAEKANPALQAARAQLAAARATVRSTRASGLPSLAVSGNYGYQFQNGFAPGDTWGLGLTLTVPLFTGFNHHYQVRQAQAQADQADAQLRQSQSTTLAQVWQDYHNFQGALASYPGARSSLDNAEKALEVVRAQYRVGQATIQDVLLAESTLAQARYTLIQKLVSSYLALAQLSQAVGMPLGEAQP